MKILCTPKLPSVLLDPVSTEAVKQIFFLETNNR